VDLSQLTSVEDEGLSWLRRAWLRTNAAGGCLWAVTVTGPPPCSDSTQTQFRPVRIVNGLRKIHLRQLSDEIFRPKQTGRCDNAFLQS
jgi:hypothetical protein